jgi:hypothetical protein
MTTAARGTGKIGPNAIIHTVAALREMFGDEGANLLHEETAAVKGAEAKRKNSSNR